jgi:hypothetical protein
MTHMHLGRQLWTGLLMTGALACTPQPQASTTDSPARQSEAPAMNQLTPQERADGWRLLFDGTQPVGWRPYRGQSMPAAWVAENGVLMKRVATDDVITRDQFGDFELALDWKLSPGGNAGIFYRGTEEYDHIYWSAPEYQLLDDARHPDGSDRLTSAGAAYSLYPSPAGVVKAGGEWNSTRIIVKGSHVEHWLNGSKLLEYELGSPDWEARVKASKFKDWPHYGRAKVGFIGIQGDHSGELQLRNIRIREISR